MACRLDGAKPLSKPMLENCWLGPEEQTSVKFKSELKYFLSRWWTWKYGLRNGVHLSRAQCSVLTDHQDHAEVIYPTDYKSQSTPIHPKGNLWPQLGVAPPLPPPHPHPHPHLHPHPPSPTPHPHPPPTWIEPPIVWSRTFGNSSWKHSPGNCQTLSCPSTG